MHLAVNGYFYPPSAQPYPSAGYDIACRSTGEGKATGGSGMSRRGRKQSRCLVWSLGTNDAQNCEVDSAAVIAGCGLRAAICVDITRDLGRGPYLHSAVQSAEQSAEQYSAV